MRKLAVSALAALLLLGIVAPASTAAPVGAFAFNGQWHLNSGFPVAPGYGSFDGVARGLAANPTLNCVSGCSMTALFTYNEPSGSCAANTAPVAFLGTAVGTYTIGSLTGNFNWTRMGTVIVGFLTNPFGVMTGTVVFAKGCHPLSARVTGVLAAD